MDKNEKLNLVDILKNEPQGTMLWSSICGDCIFEEIDEKSEYAIHCLAKNDYSNDYSPMYFTADGQYRNDFSNGECVLFPSKEDRDWSKYKIPKKHKVKPLKKEKNYIPKPFEKVFGWNNYNPFDILYPDIFLCKDINDELHKIVYHCEFGTYEHIKPYSEEEYLERNNNN